MTPFRSPALPPLLAASLLGSLGWVWDALEHARLIHLPGGEVGAHALMYVSLLAVLVLALWARRPLLGAGALITLLGVLVDLSWHRAHGEGMQAERNMLSAPGHQIELAGWLVGSLLLLALLGRARLPSRTPPGGS